MEKVVRYHNECTNVIKRSGEMRKVLKIFGFTSMIMLILLGVALFFVYKNKNVENKAENHILEEELDMQVYGLKKEDISEDQTYPLYLSGNKKNVETFTKDAKDIYNVKYSKSVKDKLNDKKKRGKYAVDDCLWAYNPFGTHELSLYLYFEASQVVSLRYTIHVEDEDIPDFTRTAKLDESMTENKKMECIISGLVPDVKNYVILKFSDTSGKEVKRIVYTITPPSIEGDVQQKLAVTDGPSLSPLTNGLYLFLGHDTDNKKVAKKIYLYDNSGILRGAIPLLNNRANRVMYIDDQLFYNYSKNGFAKVSSMGQVMKTYTLEGYNIVNDFTYDGFGSILSIVNKKGAKSKEDHVAALNLKTGKTTKLLNMGDLLKKVKQKSKDKKDWIGLNSIEWAGSDSIIVSARELSGILKIRNISSVKPTIQYIIGDENVWTAQGRKKGLLNKYVIDENADALTQDEFVSQYRQSHVSYSASETNTTDIYYLKMFNNNYLNKKTKNSYYYKYLVDETTKTYNLVASFKIPFSAYDSSVQEYKENLIINSGTDCSVSEFDTEGKLVQELKYNAQTYTYRVFKEDFKNFWFS